MAKDATSVLEKIVLLGDELYLAWLVPGQFVLAEGTGSSAYYRFIARCARLT